MKSAGHPFLAIPNSKLTEKPSRIPKKEYEVPLALKKAPKNLQRDKEGPIPPKKTKKSSTG